MDSDTSVKVAVRIRPLNPDEYLQDNTICINTVPGAPQIVAGTDTFFTFDHVFGIESTQAGIYDTCVSDLVNAAFEGFNATILAYGQTGSGKTWTMGSAAGYDIRMTPETVGIIPRVINNIFEIVKEREANEPNSTYKVFVQFLEIYGEDIKDLLDHTKTSKVTIRETAAGEVFVSGAREEVVNSAAQMMKTLEDGTRHRTTASTLMNQSSSRSHAIFTVFLEHTIHTGAVLDPVQQGAEDVNEDGAENKDDSKDGAAVDESEDQGAGSNSTAPCPVSTAQSKAEVRKCKFHFVDLAGSERAKRTGAQGQQLKEGIDINKGLLALGNVISALGDETKRGKVHVPYRDSKLTRMLQDSLGGNSKTLMICCVSPAGVNFYESLNALRYANRARNIKNKPIINRDPTMVIIDELRCVVRTLASELLDVRKAAIVPPPENSLTIEELERLLSAAPAGQLQAIASSRPTPSKLAVLPTPSGMVSRLSRLQLTDDMLASPSSSVNTTVAHRRNLTTSDALLASHSATIEAQSKEIISLKSRSSEADFEIRRLTDQLRLARIQSSELTDRVVLIQSERDFFKMKWGEANPEEAKSLDRAASKSSYEFLKAQAETEGREPPTPPDDALSGDECTPHDEARAAEKDRVTAAIAGYLREIDSLKKQIAEHEQMAKLRSAAADNLDEGDIYLEGELTSNVAKVIAQTEQHLIQEARKLKTLVSDPSVIVGSDGAVDAVIAAALENAEDDEDDGDDDKDKIYQKEAQIEVDTTAFQRRQKIMTREVSELGESIQLKEQLVNQLRRSHYQYGVMKTFYEQKLQALNEEMAAKEEERETLLRELHELEQTKHEAEAIKHKVDRQARLRDELSKKDAELQSLKKRQQELNSLSQVQSKYQQQMVKLETEIEAMKKQRVDLTKSIQTDKKKHLQALTDKAREIETLKRALNKSMIEAKKLGKDKERAEERAKEAIREGVVLRKRANDLQRHGAAAGDTARNARRAMGAAKSSTGRFLTEDELRVKKWLDRRIADINAREEAAESLRQQCEQQLALLNRKEALEAERLSFEKSVRDVIVGGDGEGASESVQKTLTREEEDALREIEDRIDSVEGQLRLRNQNITEMETKLAIAQEASEEKTVETLKRTAAVSLPAAHELIRLLFDMIVSARHLAQQRKSALARSEAKERQLREELDDASARITAVMRAHDMELTVAAHEYEEKLQGLLNHSTAGILGSGGSNNDNSLLKRGNSFSDADFPMVETPKNDKSFYSDISMVDMSSTAAHATDSFKRAEEDYKMLLAVSAEQCNVLRSQLSFESGRASELLSRTYELEHARMQLQKDLEEKDIHIKFLEDERRLFRDMADDLRTGLTTLGGAVGQTILKQVRERAAAKAERDNRSVNFSGFDGGEQDRDESEFGDETESLLGEYSNLADVISRTGGVMEKAPSTVKIPGNSKGVYDRLTNPSNFTGAMKSVFEEDLAKKRQKVQLMKSGQVRKEIGFGYGPAGGAGGATAKSERRRRNQNIVDYLEGGGSVTDDASITSDALGSSGGVSLPPPPGTASGDAGNHLSPGSTRSGSPMFSEAHVKRMSRRATTIGVTRSSLDSDHSGMGGSHYRTDSPSSGAVADFGASAFREVEENGVEGAEGVGEGDVLTVEPPSPARSHSTYFADEEGDIDNEELSVKSAPSAKTPPRMVRSNSFSSFSGGDNNSEDSSSNIGEEKVRVSSHERRLMIVADRLYAATAQGGRRNVLGGAGMHVVKRGSKTNMVPLSPTEAKSPRFRPVPAPIPPVGTLPGPSVPK